MSDDIENVFAHHPDLAPHDSTVCQRDAELLASLLRELEDEGEELMHQGISPKALCEGLISKCALGALTDRQQDLFARLLHKASGGRLRFTMGEMNMIGGLYAEAFFMGSRYTAEKHGWNEFRKLKDEAVGPVTLDGPDVTGDPEAE